MFVLHVERSIIYFAHHTPAQAYIGFTWRSGAGFDTEIARWAVATASAITRLDGEPIGGRQDLEALKFRVRFCVLMFCVQPHFPQVEILIQNSVAFNMRVVETALHRKFHQNTHRLWQKIGAGSYYLKDEDIQVSCAPPALWFGLSHDCNSINRTTRSLARCLLFMHRALQLLRWRSKTPC